MFDFPFRFWLHINLYIFRNILKCPLRLFLIKNQDKIKDSIAAILIGLKTQTDVIIIGYILPFAYTTK